MRIETIQSGSLKNNTYIIEEDNEAIIIDAAASIKDIKQKLNGAIVKGVILTHGHYDHFVNLSDILKEFKTKCYLTEQAHLKLNDAELNLSSRFGEGNTCELKSGEFKYVYNSEVLSLLKKKQIFIFTTPGHSDCGITIKIDDCLFTGDTLFKKAVGRTDLPTSDGAKLRESLRKLYKIKENCKVFPGHYASTFLDDERCI